MILDSPIISGSTVVSGSLTVSGSLYVTNPVNLSGSITSASYAATASVSGNSLSSSYAVTTSYAATASSADNFLVRGTLTAQKLVVQTITSSVVYSSGSNVFGSQQSDTQVFTGSVSISNIVAGSSAGAFISTAGTGSGQLQYRTPAQVLSDIGAQAALNNPITGSGVAGRVAFYSGASSITSDGNLFWDNTTKHLGIGAPAPAHVLHVSEGGGATRVLIDETSNSASGAGIYMRVFNGATQVSFGTIRMDNADNLGIFNGGGERVRVSGSGEVLIANSIGAMPTGGYRLDVNGNVRFNGSTYNAIFTPTGRLLLGTATENTYLLDVNGSARFIGATVSTDPLIVRKTSAGAGSGVQVTTLGGYFSVVPYIDMTLENPSGNIKTVSLYGGTLPSGSSNVAYAQYLQDANGTIALLSDITAATFYTANGTLTSNRTVTSGGYNLTFTGTNTASAAIGRGILMNHTLSASANNDVLVGLDVSTTFATGSYTGVSSYSIRTYNKYKFETLSDLSQGLYWSPANDGTTLRIYGSNYSGGVGYLQLNVLSGGDGLVVNGSSRSLTINAAQTNISLNTSTTTFYSHGVGESMRIVHATRNILIGTTTDAGYKLTVSGSGVSGSLNVNNVMYVSGSSVGINTSGSGAYTLDVSGSGIFRNALTINYGTTNRTTQLRDTGLFLSRTSDGGYASSIIADGNMTYNTRNGHIFQTDSSTKVMFLENGNVLIGTTGDAGYKLDVNGTGRFSGALTGTTVANSNSNPVIGSDGTNVYLGTNLLYRISFASNRINLNPSDGTSSISSMSVSSLNSGSVYIGGNANPTAKLQVAGPITAATALAQGVYVNTTLIAAANNDVLVGLDVNPTFTPGSFTGVTSYSVRINGANPTIVGSGSLTLREDGDALGSVALLLQNRSGVNGAMFQQLGTNDLVDFVFKGLANQRNIRYENRAGKIFSTGPEFQIGLPDNPALFVSDVAVGIRKGGLSISPVYATPPSGGLYVSGSVLVGSSVDAGFKFDVSGSGRFTNGLTVTGSLTAPSITGSLAGTASYAISSSYTDVATSASYANNAISASYAATASSADTFLVRGDQTVVGTITAQKLVVQTVTSSVVYSSGSNVFGNDLSNTQVFTGSVSVTGSLSVNGSSVLLSNQTGSMVVLSASYANNATSASYAPNFYNSDGTLNSNRTLTSNGYNLTFTGTNTASAGVGRGISINHTLAAAANNDVLVGLDISSSFNNGAFTNVQNLAARLQGITVINSTSTIGSNYPLQVVGSSGGSALFSNSAKTQALNINLTTAGETRIYGDYFGVGVDQKLILGTFAGRANQLVLQTTGNVGINTSTDAGYKLDVNGTLRTTGATLIQNTLTVSGSTTVTGSLNVTGSTTIVSSPVTSSIRGTVSIGAGAFDGVTAGFFTGSISGTSLAINEIGGFGGRLIDAQAGSGSVFAINPVSTGYQVSATTPVLLVTNISTNPGNTNVATFRSSNVQGARISILGSDRSAQLGTNGSADGLAIFGNVDILATTPALRLGNPNNSITYGTIRSNNTTGDMSLIASGSGNILIQNSTVITGSLTTSGSIRATDFLYIDSASFDYQQNLAVATGSFQTIVSVATGSYRCAFFDYVAYSGSVVRAGTVVSTWSGSVTEYYENSTADLGGSTNPVTLQAAISGSNIQLQAGISGSGWSVRSLVKLL